MVELASVDAYLDGTDPHAVALLCGLRGLVERCGRSQAPPRALVAEADREVGPGNRHRARR